jgi:hypothetical protein
MDDFDHIHVNKTFQVTPNKMQAIKESLDVHTLKKSILENLDEEAKDEI